jgi:hypothetical protein
LCRSFGQQTNSVDKRVKNHTDPMGNKQNSVDERLKSRADPVENKQTVLMSV